MEEAMKIISYLRRTSERGILFKKNNNVDLLAYIDVSWAGDRDGRKLTSR